MWVYLYPNNTETELKNAYIWEYSEETVQTFDFQNDWSLNWTGYGIGYGTPDYVTGQGWKIWTSSSSSYQWWITIPNSVFQWELKSIKIYWYKPEATTSSKGSAVWICNQNQTTICEYWRMGTWGTIMYNWTKISNLVDPTWEITTEWIMESNWDLTVKINDTSYNVGSYASTFKDLRTNKALYIEMWRWDKPTHYIRKIEITTA